MKFSAYVKIPICIVLLLSLLFTICSCGFSGSSSSSDWWGNVKDKAGDIAGNIADKAGDIAGSIADKAGDIAGNIADKAGDIAGNIADKAGDIAGNVKDKASDWIKGASSKSQEWFIAAKDAIVNAYGTAKDGVVYAYNEVADWTVTGYEKASKKATEIIGNVSDYISGLRADPVEEQIVWAESDPEYPLKDLSQGVSFDETGSYVLDDRTETERFAAYYLASVLGARGYSAYNGAVYYKDKLYGGLIFTTDEVFIEEDGRKIYSCGFIQLVSKDYSGLRLTDKIVQSGLIAVPADAGASADAYIVEDYATIPSFGGVYNDHYFEYRQAANYVMEISVMPNESRYYNHEIELYDFDAEREIFMQSESDQVTELYLNNPQCYDAAVTTVNAIADYEENSENSISTVIVLDGNTLDSAAECAKTGTSSVKNFFQKGLDRIRLLGSQFLSFDSQGQAHVLGSENAVDADRTTNGIISTVGSGLAAAGTVASVICAASASGPVITAIVITTGVSAIVYNVSNLLAGVQDVYYGARGDSTESQNPVLALFKRVIPDEKTASLVYHIWGISNMAISMIMMPVSKALSIAKSKGLNFFRTAGAVIRASVTTVAKALATGIGAGIVGNYVSKVVKKATNNGNLAKLAGFGSGLISGMLLYKGLDKLDQKLNVSGLYPKTTVKQAYAREREEDFKNLYKEEYNYKQREKLQKMLEQIRDYAAEETGVINKPSIKVIHDPNVGNCGLYDPNTNTIEINMWASEHQDIRGIADTIAHETRHVWQNEYAALNPSSDMAYSLNHYIESPNPNNFDFNNQVDAAIYRAQYNAYKGQTCERDAFEFGNNFAERFVGWIRSLSFAA